MSDSDLNVGEGTSVIKKRKYDQHFKEEWRSEESFKGWLVGSDKWHGFMLILVFSYEIPIIILYYKKR